MKTKLMLLLLLSITSLVAQEKVTLEIFTDAKLLFTGDDKGNDPGTIDVIIQSSWQGKQIKQGFIFVFPKFEIADLDGGTYIRYAAGVGFTFNNFYLKKIEASAQVNFGIQQRFGRGFSSFEIGTDLSYKVKECFKLSALLTYTERKDLLYRWGVYEWRINGYLGIKYNIN